MLSRLRSLFSFPLLTKELAERAARPRTYWLRIGAALLLFGGFWFDNDHIFKSGTIEAVSVLGAGEGMFEATTQFLFICIAAFVPAMLCGVITQEKERDSLVLLLLTRMRPWQIVLQKYVGGLIPGLTILFLAMPLVAVAYAYGGVTTAQVGIALAILILAILQVGAFALWASCYCRTTVSSFLMTYFAGGLVFGLPELLVGIDRMFRFGLIGRNQRWLAHAHLPPAVLTDAMGGGGAVDLQRFGIGCLAIAGVTVVFLLAAIYHLPRCAFDRPSNRLRRIFAAIDRWAHRANRRFGGITFGRKEESLPGESPIIWREKRARSLARPEYLVRLLVVILIPVVLISVLFANDSGEGLSITVAVLAGLSLLALSTTAANGIVNERVNQTFEVLLTTPTTASSILRQKARALLPFLVMLAIPILVVCTIEFVTEWDGAAEMWRTPLYPNWIYPVCTLLTTAIYFPLFSWVSIWMGLWCKTRIRAIVTTLIVMIVWIVGPVFVVAELNADRTWAKRYVYLFSPAVLPALNEEGQLTFIDSAVPWMPVFVNCCFYGGVLILIRRHCLKHADWYLRR